MVASKMVGRGTSSRQVVRQLEVTEGALRYRLRSERRGAPMAAR